MLCVKCGKEMTNVEDGTTIIGISINCRVAEKDKSNTKLVEFLQKQLGKYHVGETYAFCYECWLDSLFGVQETGWDKLLGKLKEGKE